MGVLSPVSQGLCGIKKTVCSLSLWPVGKPVVIDIFRKVEVLFIVKAILGAYTARQEG